MREEIILDLVLNSTWDLFQMPQLRELQCTQIQHACRNIQRAKKPLFLVPKKILQQNNQECKKIKIKNITHLLRKMLERRRT